MTDKQPDQQHESDDLVVEQLTQRLERQAAELDAATLSRLRQGRAAALAELENKSPRRMNNWVWAGGFASASVFAIALLLVLKSDPTVNQEFEQMLADTELLSEAEELEFFEELEFYVWLEEQGLNPSEA